MPNKKRIWILTVTFAACLAAALGIWWALRPAAPPPAELPRASLVKKDGRMCPRDGGGPFTGVMFERTSAGQRLSEVPLKEGIVDGLARGWYDSGQLEVEERFVEGVSQGVRKRWHVNGRLKNEATIVDGQLDGPYQEWHDNGQKAVVMTLVKGKGEGLCETWHPDGNLKSRVTLENGEPVKKEYFSSKTGEVVEK